VVALESKKPALDTDEAVVGKWGIMSFITLAYFILKF
jgi:hypothetical protein